jgi:hypothetical protein
MKKTIPLENVTYVCVCDSLVPREMINDFVYFLVKVALKYTTMEYLYAAQISV